MPSELILHRACYTCVLSYVLGATGNSGFRCREVEKQMQIHSMPLEALEKSSLGAAHLLPSLAVSGQPWRRYLHLWGVEDFGLRKGASEKHEA